MEGISNLYIESILLPRTSTFSGVFSCDKIPRSLCNKRKFSVIVNLSKFNQRGTHWVAIFRDQSKLIYYDAVGLPLINKDITRFLKSFDQEYTFNTFESQCFQSTKCGFFCILFILLMEQDMTFTKFKKLFSKKCTENEKRVISLLKYTLKKL